MKCAEIHKCQKTACVIKLLECVYSILRILCGFSYISSRHARVIKFSEAGTPPEKKLAKPVGSSSELSGRCGLKMAGTKSWQNRLGAPPNSWGDFRGGLPPRKVRQTPLGSSPNLRQTGSGKVPPKYGGVPPKYGTPGWAYWLPSPGSRRLRGHQLPGGCLSWGRRSLRLG